MSNGNKRGVLPNMGDVTPATSLQVALATGGRRANGTRRKKKRTKRTSTRTSTRRATTPRKKRGKKRLVKGSAAARQHMARLRRMRKKKR